MAKQIKTFLTFRKLELPGCFREWNIDGDSLQHVHPATQELYLLADPRNVQCNKEFVAYLEEASLDELLTMIFRLGCMQMWKAQDLWCSFRVPVVQEDKSLRYADVKAPSIRKVDGEYVDLNIWERFAMEQSVIKALLQAFRDRCEGHYETLQVDALEHELSYTANRMSGAGDNVAYNLYPTMADVPHYPCPFTWNRVIPYVNPVPLVFTVTEVDGKVLKAEDVEALMVRRKRCLEKAGFHFVETEPVEEPVVDEVK